MIVNLSLLMDATLIFHEQKNLALHKISCLATTRLN